MCLHIPYCVIIEYYVREPAMLQTSYLAGTPMQSGNWINKNCSLVYNEASFSSQIGGGTSI